MISSLVKKMFHLAGLKVERRDRLLESIPAQYNLSPFLPRVYRGGLHQYLYYLDMLDKVRNVEGDIVECGVSVGHGALLFLLLSEYLGVERTYYGFDSFEGLPDPSERDGITPIKEKGLYANPPATVLKVLRDGRLPENVIQDRVRLVKGWFSDTISKYDGRIALLHLDCDLYDSYKTCLEALYDKVVPGGVIMFDEYADERWTGARTAIDEFFAGKPEIIQAHDKCEWKYHTIKK
jgi:hypothetical protein